MIRTAIFVTAALAAFTAAAQQRVFPSDPQDGETFALVWAYAYGGTSYFTTTSAQRDGAVITVAQPQVPGGAATQWSRFGATIAGLAPGTYTVRGGPYANTNPYAYLGTRAFESTVTVVPGAPASPQYRELDGNWFDPAQPGWGVNLVQGDAGALFAVWLGYSDAVYGSANYPAAWLVLPAGRWVSPNTFRGLLYESAGTRITEPTRSSQISPVGMATLEFLGEDRVRVHTIRATNAGNWVEGEWTLRRFAF